MAPEVSSTLPEGIFSLLDTDLYKLTMQCCVLKYFPDVSVTYSFTNRTPDMKFSRAAFYWLQAQVDSDSTKSLLLEYIAKKNIITELANVSLSEEELQFLSTTCAYLNEQYLRFLSNFRLQPSKQIKITFNPNQDTGQDNDLGDVMVHTQGLWVDTILYEIPLLALISEAYFKFCDRDWTYAGQVEKARRKGAQLLENGCIFSEFGSRRRRDYHTQDLILQGLRQAQDEAAHSGWKGKLSGTSNVHFAMKHGLLPVGTVAHEWFMGVAAITNDYENANEIALRYWVATFGEGVLGIALTDTYGTPTFLKEFKKTIPAFTSAAPRPVATLASATAGSAMPTTGNLSKNKSPIHAPPEGETSGEKTYAQVFTGVRQDSGDPLNFIQLMRDFYDEQGIKDKKTIVFSDSLNIELCLKYKAAAEAQGFQPTFGVGTFLTNDFIKDSSGKKSIPLNIVIKMASAAGRPAVKISDNIGKNTGDKATVAEVKQRLGYEEKDWTGGDERTRWGKADERTPEAAT